MGLAQLTEELAWPSPDSILAPPGPGPSTNLAVARQKILSATSTLQGGERAQVGLLCADPRSKATEAPLAIVCTFEERAQTDTLVELHRVAWNFSNAPLLLTVDKTEVRAFTCSEPPSGDETQKLKPEISEARYVLGDVGGGLARNRRASLHWLEIATGSFMREHQNRFNKKNRADSLLLDNLQLLRARLHDDGLPYEVIHDLLARTIFVQFLFDRKDANGFTALNGERLTKLREQGVLSGKYKSFSEILLNHDDAYRLFQHLDEKFNGDLFPSLDAGDQGLRPEREIVLPEHLAVLSDFISGDLSLRSQQRSLWPMYSFDSIPLDFISSIYESFVEHDGQAIYTPPHLVDFVLDGVLPWDDINWDMKVLDPSCGSGIFLVKALRRLVHRWKLSNGDLDARIPVEPLRCILQHNLFGVDKDPHAIRVASFSLYLAMCDEIEPKYLWSNVKFPSLRGQQLKVGDFFDPSISEHSTKSVGELYDVIVGNAPWGKNTMTKFAGEWAHANGWPVSYGDIGPMFLAKSATLCKPKGVVSLLQPTGTLLTNTSTPACDFRARLFSTLAVTEVVNLSAMRFGLFRNAVGPSSLITLNQTAAGDSINYVCPKPSYQESIDCYRVLIDQYDIHEIHRDEASVGTDHWTTLFWGTRRDLALLRKLEKSRSLLDYEEEGKVIRRRGIIRNSTQSREQKVILGRLILEESNFPDNCFLSLALDDLRRNKDATTYSRDSTNFDAFEPNQMLIKMAWTVDESRFRAVLVDSQDTGVLCSQGYITVRANLKDSAVLEAACMMLNSNLAVYYQLGHSGRFATYRPAPEVKELLGTPIPTISGINEATSFDEVDERVYGAANLNESERALIDHTLNFVLPDLKAGANSARHARLKRTEAQNLVEYCEWFMMMLRTGMGNRSLSATVFDLHGDENPLPLRLVVIVLGSIGREREEIVTERISADSLWSRITDVYTLLDESASTEELCPRVARVFGFVKNPTKPNIRIPALFVVKSDQKRYWTRAMAMRDADDVSAKLFAHGRQSLPL